MIWSMEKIVNRIMMVGNHWFFEESERPDRKGGTGKQKQAHKQTK